MDRKPPLKKMPFQVKGNYKDDFFKMNPEVELFPEMSKLKSSFRRGKKEKSSEVMWAFCMIFYPGSFFRKEIDSEKMKEFLSKNYFKSWWNHKKWNDFDWLEDWWIENILVSPKQKKYQFAKRSYNEQMKNPKMSLPAMRVQESVLEEMEREANSEWEEVHDYWEIQGEDQPGLLQRTIRK